MKHYIARLILLPLVLISVNSSAQSPQAPAITLDWYIPGKAVKITWQAAGWQCLKRNRGGIQTQLTCTSWGTNNQSVRYLWSWGPVDTTIAFMPGDTAIVCTGATCVESTPLNWPYQRWFPWVAKSP